jgi:hypothetical protein
MAVAVREAVKKSMNEKRAIVVDTLSQNYSGGKCSTEAD